VNRVHVDLTGPPQTMLATLYAKALDAEAARPILGDQYAKAAVARIDYDWETTTINARRAPSVAVRTLHFDNWTRQFLAVHEPAHGEVIVVHVGCGLDARVYRLDPGPGVRWYDVDYPEVIGLRERVYPGRTNYRMLPASVTDPSWLDEIPPDNPALLLGEGLTPYLTRDDGLALLRRVVDRFPSGELQFDAFSTFGNRASQFINPIVRRSGSMLHWAINRPSDILDTVPGTRLLIWQSVFDSDTFDLLTPVNRWLGRGMAAIPMLRNIGQYHRYAFGEPRAGKRSASTGVAPDTAS
jgi:O-methyltransferase involved in polyketide biosynthesis